MMDLIALVKDLPLTEIGQIVLMVLGVASAVAKLTPTKSDDKIVDAVFKVVHGLGLTK